MSPRCYRLRRPPVIHVVAEPFVPNDVSADEVDRRWQVLCRSNPAFFDGRLYHVLGVHRNGHGGVAIHVVETAYRYFAVQTDEFDLHIRALGLKAVTWRNGRVLLGRRSTSVAAYQGSWEFAPSGGAEIGVDPSTMIARELVEETGLSIERPAIPIAVMEDPIVRTWEIVYRIDLAGTNHASAGAEYDELRWATMRDLPTPMSPFAMQMKALVESDTTNAAPR